MLPRAFVVTGQCDTPFTFLTPPIFGSYHQVLE